MSEPLFPEDIRATMRLGTSSQWATDLTTDDLPALLWMVGEFGRRAHHILETLDEHWSVSPPRDAVAAARAKLALEGLFRFFAGDRPTEKEYIARWGPIAERAWAAGHGRAPELPPEEMGDLWPMVWEGKSVGSLKDPHHNINGCVGLWIPTIPASNEFAIELDRLPDVPIVLLVGGIKALVVRQSFQSGEMSVFWLGQLNSTP
jgi:hypothetical protein